MKKIMKPIDDLKKLCHRINKRWHEGFTIEILGGVIEITVEAHN